MRICDLTTLYLDGAQGGVNTYLTEKARALAERPEVDAHLVVVPGRTTTSRPLLGSTVQTLKSPTLPGNPQHRVLTHFAEVRRILRGFAPDVIEVDCAYFLGEVVRWCRDLQRVPIVGLYHVHLPAFISGTWLPGFGRLANGLTERLAWRYVDFCRRQCDRLVVTSTDIRGRLAAEGYRDLHCVPLGVNLELFQPGAGPVDPVDPVDLVDPEVAPLALYVGRLSPEKQVSVLIDAYRELSRRRPLRLRIVGDGPLEARLRRRAEGLDIQFAGAVPYGEALAAEYAAADVFVHPGANETFNLTLLEALAADLPVVAANRGGPTDLVTDAVGALAAPDSPTDLAACIEQLLDRRPARGVCRAHVESRYSWTRTFDQLLDVYRGAIADAQDALAPVPARLDMTDLPAMELSAE